MLDNQLTELLEIDHPILQAPMGGESTPAMAAAVANAGGLGGFGCSYLSRDEIERGVFEIRAAASGSFNLNFFAHPEPQSDPEVDAATRARVADFYRELGIEDTDDDGAAPDGFTRERLELMLELQPKVVSFHFGLPPLESVRALQEVGIVVLCSATTVAEAVWLDEAGVDAIIAQGWEAGGHRGAFDLTYEDVGVGGLALIPQVVDAVRVPVIATGGIADGRGIAAALTLGAQGVQLGTAFLACPEANIPPAYRETLKMARDDETRLTRAFSGRPARARNNRYIEFMARERSPLPDFPLMYRFSRPLEQAGADGRANGFDFTLYGQAAALNRELPAAELVALLVDETLDAIANKARLAGGR